MKTINPDFYGKMFLSLIPTDEEARDLVCRVKYSCLEKTSKEAQDKLKAEFARVVVRLSNDFHGDIQRKFTVGMEGLAYAIGSFDTEDPKTSFNTHAAEHIRRYLRANFRPVSLLDSTRIPLTEDEQGPKSPPRPNTPHPILQSNLTEQMVRVISLRQRDMTLSHQLIQHVVEQRSRA